jgi:hypothetical protein
VVDEPIYTQPVGIIDRMQARRIARRAHPHALINFSQALDNRRSRFGTIHRVVYNSISAPNCSASEDDADTASGASAGSCEPAEDPVLAFESRFESGNLRRAVLVGKNEYDLVLQTDVNTNGHTQWFFFRIDNTVAGARYKLNIINMMKRDSLYNNGLMPLCHSALSLQLEGRSWQRCGSDICYYPNSIRRKGCSISYYTLTFTYQAKYSHDSVFFAHSYPYTYSDLVRYCSQIEAQPQSRSGRAIPLLRVCNRVLSLTTFVTLTMQLSRAMQTSLPDTHWQLMPNAHNHVIHL